jgi:hypothetical protein
MRDASVRCLFISRLAPLRFSRTTENKKTAEAFGLRRGCVSGGRSLLDQIGLLDEEAAVPTL